jgi:uncharacterized protein YndB with AHSA1/START domain
MLVRAPVAVVYATLTDVDGWGLWWRGCRTERRAPQRPTAEGDHHRITTAGRWRRETFDARVHGWRHDEGLHATLCDRRGRTVGDVEWWLEPCPDGTVVHLLFGGSAAGRRRQRGHAAMRAGLQDLKDHLELAVEVAVGRVP